MSYMKQKHIELHNTLADIGAGLNPTGSGFGIYKKQHDFRIQPEGNLCIIWADSEAALLWCYDNLPEEVDRWCANGFAIETRYIEPVVAGMERDGLTMNSDAEEELTREQWWQQEDQDAQYIESVTGADMEIS